MRTVLIAAVAAIAVPASQAAEKAVELKPGPGLEKVVAHCSACHSLDYLPMNSPFLDVAGWNTEVAKMINAFGAGIDQADAKMIAEYLATNYGLPQQAARPGAAEGESERGFRGIRPKGVAPKPRRRKPGSVRGAGDERTGRE
jgi:sulfite dehydrogenase (cytochrome) subunit B